MASAAMQFNEFNFTQTHTVTLAHSHTHTNSTCLPVKAELGKFEACPI